MKRRLNLAAAIMHKPRLLILDEPTVGIDPQSRNNIFEYLRKVNSQDKTTILYTSHYMEEVEELCKNIFVIDEGIDEDIIEKISLLDGALNVEKEANTLNILYERDKVNLDGLIKILQTSGAVIKAIQINELNLGEVFLQLTGKKLRE